MKRAKLRLLTLAAPFLTTVSAFAGVLVEMSAPSAPFHFETLDANKNPLKGKMKVRKLSWRIIRIAASAYLSAALTCCVSHAAPSDCAVRKVKVACIGDSITSGYRLAHPDRDAFPAQLQLMLGDGYEVRNFGVPGLGVYLHLPWHTTKNGKRAWSLSPTCAEALAWSPDIVVSNLGANDLDEYPKEFLPGTNGAPALARGTFRRQYADVLNAFKADDRSPHILMWTRLCAMKEKHAAKYGLAMFVMAEDLKAVADAVGAEGIDMYSVTAEFARKEEWPDQTHPPPSVHRVIAEVIFKSLKNKVNERNKNDENE